jgi:hypothetical protein
MSRAQAGGSSPWSRPSTLISEDGSTGRLVRSGRAIGQIGTRVSMTPDLAVNEAGASSNLSPRAISWW